MKPTAATQPGNSKIIHENPSYYIAVGLPPATPDMPNPIEAYIIINKETGVWESWHSILFYAKDTADQLHKQLTRPPRKEEAEEAVQQGFTFN